MAINPTVVQELLGTSKDVANFIATAQLILDEDLADKGMSQTRLDQIGQYLAAHFGQISLRGGQLRAATIDGATDRFAGDFGDGFDSTAFGQQAMELDTSRTLSTLNRSSYKPVLRVL